jgi:hypothetical protein
LRLVAVSASESVIGLMSVPMSASEWQSPVESQECQWWSKKNKKKRTTTFTYFEDLLVTKESERPLVAAIEKALIEALISKELKQENRLHTLS